MKKILIVIILISAILYGGSKMFTNKNQAALVTSSGLEQDSVILAQLRTTTDTTRTIQSIPNASGITPYIPESVDDCVTERALVTTIQAEISRLEGELPALYRAHSDAVRRKSGVSASLRRLTLQETALRTKKSQLRNAQTALEACLKSAAKKNLLESSFSGA
jgi:hypothetical protein